MPDSARADLLAAQLEPSYITILGGVGNIQPLLFEDSIAPHFTLRAARDSRWSVVVTPKAVLRMFRKSDFVSNGSLPVRTPSYRPRVTLYYMPGEPRGVTRLFLFGGLNHHSNGQEDPSTRGDTINMVSGNFSTNYVETGVTWASVDPGAFAFFRLSAERHFKQDILLAARYGQWRANGAFSFMVTLNEKASSYAVLSQDASWLADADLPPGSRFTSGTTVAWKPPWLDEMFFFANAYFGRDYYNIHYFRPGPLTVLRFGIMASGARFDFHSLGGR